MHPEHTPETDYLFEAILSLKTKEECDAFLNDLCTIREKNDMAQRLAVAVMLKKGARYQTISAETGASSATISRVSRCLSGNDGGYRTILDRLDGEANQKTESKETT